MVAPGIFEMFYLAPVCWLVGLGWAFLQVGPAQVDER